MEKKLKALLDFQKFEKNPKLDNLINESLNRYGTELSDDEAALANAAGDLMQNHDKSSEKVLG